LNNRQKHSMFYLLYAMVLIDNRVIKIEVDQFFIAVEDFLTSMDFMDSLRAKSYISSWFVQNYKDILREMKAVDREKFLMVHVKTLASSEHRLAIFKMMQKVAISDNDLHASEAAFLEKVAKTWDLEATDIQ